MESKVYSNSNYDYLVLFCVFHRRTGATLGRCEVTETRPKGSGP